MKDYGREFKGSVWIQSVPTKPVWAAADERRVIYAEDENKVYVGGLAANSLGTKSVQDGGDGGAGSNTANLGGGGGGQGGCRTGAGGNGESSHDANPGIGGTGGSGGGGGNGGNGGADTGPGLTGVAPGGGGGGAGGTNNTAGPGAAGRVILSWTAAERRIFITHC